MKVISDFRGHYDDAVERNFNYEQYGDDSPMLNKNIF